jgi:2-keto-4-pentenoate hydratase/2-oxohepta-3-ene-1,7-dioic acid hydratase in catechol pathway
MRLVTFRSETGEDEPGRLGAVLGEQVVDLVEAFRSAGLGMPADATQPMAWLDIDAPWVSQARDIANEISADQRARERLEQRGAMHARDSVRLMAPVPRPGKILCIGLNYRDHAQETGAKIPERPILFSKFPTAVIGPGQAIELPRVSDRVDFEAELGVVIGRRCRRVTRERALECVLGYLNVNDVSARDLQRGDGQWQRGKSCDTFAPMGPWITTSDEIPDPGRLAIRLRLNGQTMQDSSTEQMIFGVPELIAFLSEAITLEPGDVISTGTPPGVGVARKPPVFLGPGDQVEVEVEGLGVLANPVVAAE